MHALLKQQDRDDLQLEQNIIKVSYTFVLKRRYNKFVGDLHKQNLMSEYIHIINYHCCS